VAATGGCPRAATALSRNHAKRLGPGWYASGDRLGVNELHGSQYWSLVQLTGLSRSY
jgi:hypothetical protein